MNPELIKLEPGIAKLIGLDEQQIYTSDLLEKSLGFYILNNSLDIDTEYDLPRHDFYMQNVVLDQNLADLLHGHAGAEVSFEKLINVIKTYLTFKVYSHQLNQVETKFLKDEDRKLTQQIRSIFDQRFYE